MRRLIPALLPLVLFAQTALFAQTTGQPAPAGFPFSDESLTYSINWPTGSGLGESHLRARHSGAQWNFEMTIDAGIPGYQVKDFYRSVASTDFCTTVFNRNTAHGLKKVEEKESVAAGEVTRATLHDGGESHIVAPGCLKDALAFLYFARRELGQGRMPAAQPVLFGGLTAVGFVYAGAETVAIGGKPTLTDKVNGSVKTTSADVKFEIFFARDAARTPLLVRLPLAAGTFAMEIVR